jgi:iron complex transport system substrate-binding protein
LVVATAPAGVAATPASDASVTAQEDCTFPVTVTDATGTEVTVTEQPDRLVTLQASSAQILWELGIQDRVVGMPVRPSTAYLDGSQSKTNVVNVDGSVNLEQVVALDPDLVLAPNAIPDDTISQLRAAGLTVHKADFPSSLSGIRSQVELAGLLTGECAAATDVNEEFDADVEAVRNQATDRYEPRTFYYFFEFTAGEGTFIDEIIETAGGRNSASEAGVVDFKQVNLEQVAEQDPEVIFVADTSSVPEGSPWESTTAFETGNVYEIDSDLLNQPAPRVVEPMSTMQQRLAERAVNVRFGGPNERIDTTGEVLTAVSEFNEPNSDLDTADVLTVITEFNENTA